MRPEFEGPKEPLLNKACDAVVVLGTVMNFNQDTNTWSFPDELIIPYKGITLGGGKIRTDAAAVMLRKNLTKTLLVTGGEQFYKGQSFSRSEEMSKILIGEYKLPESNVINIGRPQSGSTNGNLNDVVHFLSNTDMTCNSLGILTNAVHMGRALYLFGSNPFFQQRSSELKPITAETVLRMSGDLSIDEIHTFYDRLGPLRAAERNGVKLLRKGTYRLR